MIEVLSPRTNATDEKEVLISREITLTLTDTTHELARTEILRLAARDLRSAGEQIEELATDIWPVGFHRLDDAQCALQLVRESLAAVEQIGWPDADDGAAHPGGG